MLESNATPPQSRGTGRRSVVDHLTLGVTDLARSRGFYGRALRALAFAERGPWSEQHNETSFGAPGADDFAISTRYGVGGAVHVALTAESRRQVDAFHAA